LLKIFFYTGTGLRKKKCCIYFCVVHRERAKEKARKEGKALDSPPPVKKTRQEALPMVNLDADDPVDDSDDSDGDSDDDTAMLMAELQKIKAEKAKEEAEKVS
jgi:protein CWC15